MRMTNPKSVMSRGRQLVLAAGAGCALLGGAWTATAVPVPQTAVYHVGGDVSAPVLTYSIDAKFPKAERKNHMGKGGWHGIAEVALIVDPSGTPRYVHITRSLAPDFDRNAVTAVRQYRFKPAMRHGQPVAVDVKVEVNYRIY